MTEVKIFLKWKKIAEDDLKMAELALQNGLWLQCAFHCQQSVEKMLKGCMVLLASKEPPYTHDLARLYAELPALGASFPFDARRFSALSVYYTGARYPSYKEDLSQTLSKEALNEYLELAQELLKWAAQKQK